MDDLTLASLCIVFVVGGLSLLGLSRFNPYLKREQPVPTPASPTPRLEIVEDAKFRSGGVVCIILIIVMNVLLLVTFTSAKTVLQEITDALIWIGTNQILTTGIIVGRRRRFQIWRHGRI